MNKVMKLVLAASAVATVSVSAHAADAMAASPYSAYVQDGRNVVSRSGYDLCIRTGYWTPADAVVVGCDGVMAKAEEVVAEEAKAAVTAEKVTYAADAFFDFDKATLKAAGKDKLNMLVKHVADVDVEVIIATGHTDATGPEAYNEKLAMRRAESVKAYLVSQGIDAKQVYTEGKGEKQPIASNSTRADRAKNRRVEIEVVGTRK